MPPEVRWFIKTSLLCLLGSAFMGTLAFGWGAVFEGPPPPSLRPLHIHMATVGWLLNLVFGVALWMFPMAKGATREFKPRYPRVGAVACYASLNLGLALRFVAEPLSSAPLGLMSGALQTLAIVLAAGMLWPRIRAITPPVPTASPPSRSREGT